MTRLDFIPHPQSRFATALRVGAEVEFAPEGRLSLRYFISGDVGAIRLPAPAASARTDELWRTTCFEAFLRPEPGEAYCEFNFAPSTQWAAYRFDRYREGMRRAEEVGPPSIIFSADPSRLELHAAIDLGELPVAPHDAIWRLGLSAIIEETGGAKSYWALAHPPGAPDFHHADCFAYELVWKIRP
ncbi:MAG: DOMON-like domain-containing protein [Pseudomonadota bacterium]